MTDFEALIKAPVPVQLKHMGAHLTDHEERIRSLERMAWRVLGASTVGAIIGGSLVGGIIELLRIGGG